MIDLTSSCSLLNSVCLTSKWIVATPFNCQKTGTFHRVVEGGNEGMETYRYYTADFMGKSVLDTLAADVGRLSARAQRCFKRGCLPPGEHRYTFYGGFSVQIFPSVLGFILVH